MKPFELRLAEHHARNLRHLRNLARLSEDPERFSAISKKEQSMILLQIEHMSRLDDVLTARMQLHNIPV